MNKNQANKYLNALRAETTPVTTDKGWHQFKCPLAPWRHEMGVDGSPSMGVHIKPNQKSLFNCFACNYSGDAQDLAMELNHLCKGNHDMDLKTAMEIATAEEDEAGLATESILIPDWEDEDTNDFYEFPEWLIDTYPLVEVNKDAKLYLKKRNVPREVWEELDLRWDATEQRILFPIRTFDGKLAGLHGRSIDPEDDLKYRMYTFEKEKNPFIWMGENWIDWDMPVVLCESVFDLVRIYQCYRNVMCALTASVKSRKLARLEDGYSFVHVWDEDKAGAQARQRIIEEYPSAIHKVVTLPPKNDPADLDVFTLSEMLEKYITLDEILC